MIDKATGDATGDDDQRDPLEIIAERFMNRQRSGEAVSVSQYADEYPELAEQIRELFPAIAAMERLKQSSGDGPVSLGAARPQRLGDFRIIREIGRGGMGIVYEAEQESLGRRVAIKLLPRQLLAGTGQFVRFVREARLAAQLHHTNIVPVFGVGDQDGFHYYVMQLIQGVGLDRVVAAFADPQLRPDRHSPVEVESADTELQVLAAVLRDLGVESKGLLQVAQASPLKVISDPRHLQWIARIGLQVADALHQAHSQGILHRDIKPANILVDAHGTAWVTDFGLASILHSSSTIQTQELSGTPRYMAPEQFSGRADGRSDLYSLGLTLYELLALTPAFRDTDRTDLIRHIVKGHPRRLRDINPHVPQDLETIVAKAIERDPEQRYASAAAMAADLRCFLEDRPIAARPISPAERLWRWCRRNKAVASLAASTLTLILAVAVVASVGFVHTRRALAREAEERRRAEAVAALAGEALDRVFFRLGPAREIPSQFAAGGPEETNVQELVQPAISQETAALLQELLPFYDRLAKQTGDDVVLQRRAATARRRIGDIWQRLGRYDQAALAYQQAIEIYTALRAEQMQDPTLLLNVAQACNEIGKTFLLARNFAEAQQAHQRALGLLESVETKEAKVRFELARTYFFLGQRTPREPGAKPRNSSRVQPSEEPPTESPRLTPGPVPDPARKIQSQHLERAIRLLTGLTQEEPTNPGYRHLLALCYREVVAAPDPGDANAVGKAIDILERLVHDFPQIAEYRLDLCETYAAVEPIEPGQPQRAFPVMEERLSKALALSKQLTAQHPNVPEYFVAQARIHHRLGGVFRQMRRLDDAEASDRAALEIQAQLAKSFPEIVTYQVWQAAFSNSLTDLLLRREKLPEARALVEANIEHIRRLSDDHPELWHLNALLMESNRTLAAVLRRSGDVDLASKADAEAERYRAKLNEESSSPSPKP